MQRQARDTLHARDSEREQRRAEQPEQTPKASAAAAEASSRLCVCARGRAACWDCPGALCVWTARNAVEGSPVRRPAAIPVVHAPNFGADGVVIEIPCLFPLSLAE